MSPLINVRIHKSRIFFLSLCFLISGFAFAQDTTGALRDTTHSIKDTVKKMMPADSIPKVATQVANVNKVDSVLKHHSPKKAALRSAILPGLGQVYNKKYWKVPIVYGALGIAGAIFNYNYLWYKRTRFAYAAKYKASQPNPDSTDYRKILPELLPIDMNSLRNYRDEFRKNIDYSALFFILMWGLNVVDATVDAHLKPFDVSNDLTLKFKVGPSEMARTTGVSLVLMFKDSKRQTTNGNSRVSGTQYFYP
jgi:hypothetical protein